MTFLFLILSYRIEEEWEELQAEVGELPEA